jgi:hypothetical protein
MLPTVYLTIAATTVAGSITRLIRCWISARHQIALAREYDKTLLNALRQLQGGHNLELVAPDGCRWSVRPGSSNQIVVTRKGIEQ